MKYPLGRLARGAAGASLTLALAACGVDQGSLFGPPVPDAAAPGSGEVIGFQDTDAGAGAEGDAGDAALLPANDGATTCGATTLAAAPQPANVLLVLDTSASMLDAPPGFGSSKFAALSSALSSALTKASSSVAFGLETYPRPTNDPRKSDNANVCAMPDAPDLAVSVAPAAVAPILAALAAITPNGGTPTAAALANALAYFQSPAAAQLVGPKYVLLATDGGPDCNPQVACDASACTFDLDGQFKSGNCCTGFGADSNMGCVDDAATTAAVAALASAGIPTFVVGIPGSEAYATWLDGFARAGKVPRAGASHAYYAVEAAGGVSGFEATLESITTSLIKTCRLQLASVPPDPALLNVTVDGVAIPRDDPDGWSLDPATTPATVVLQGATCAGIEARGASTAKVVYGCPSQTPDTGPVTIVTLH